MMLPGAPRILDMAFPIRVLPPNPHSPKWMFSFISFFRLVAAASDFQCNEQLIVFERCDCFIVTAALRKCRFTSTLSISWQCCCKTIGGEVVHSKHLLPCTSFLDASVQSI